MSDPSNVGSVTADFVWCSCGWIRERAAHEDKLESWIHWEAHLDADHPVPSRKWETRRSWIGLAMGVAALVFSLVTFTVLVVTPSSPEPAVSPTSSAPLPSGAFTVQCPTGTATIVISYEQGRSSCFGARGEFLGYR